MTRQRELVHYYRRLRRHGLNDSHSGNGSVRSGDRIWLTPTGACGDNLRGSALVDCAQEDEPPAGATRDAAIHLAVYRSRSDSGAVLHCHAVHAVALTLGGGDFVPVDLEGQYYFGRVPVVDVPFARWFEDSAGAIGETLAEHPVCIARGHGVYARGRTPEEAYKWCTSVEGCARIAWLAGRPGTGI